MDRKYERGEAFSLFVLGLSILITFATTSAHIHDQGLKATHPDDMQWEIERVDEEEDFILQNMKEVQPKKD